MAEAQPTLPSEFLEAWNAIPQFVHARCLTQKRLRYFQARARDADWQGSWREALAKAARLPFCLGKNDRGWRATVDWFLRPDTVTKILEGTYDDRKTEADLYGGLREWLNRGEAVGGKS